MQQKIWWLGGTVEVMLRLCASVPLALMQQQQLQQLLAAAGIRSVTARTNTTRQLYPGVTQAQIPLSCRVKPQTKLFPRRGSTTVSALTLQAATGAVVVADFVVVVVLAV